MAITAVAASKVEWCQNPSVRAVFHGDHCRGCIKGGLDTLFPAGRSARLDIEIKDRFGQPVVPHEWFLVPLFVIDEVVEKIRASTISNFKYDPKSASLVEAADREST